MLAVMTVVACLGTLAFGAWTLLRGADGLRVPRSGVMVDDGDVLVALDSVDVPWIGVARHLEPDSRLGSSVYQFTFPPTSVGSRFAVLLVGAGRLTDIESSVVLSISEVDCGSFLDELALQVTGATDCTLLTGEVDGNGSLLGEFPCNWETNTIRAYDNAPIVEIRGRHTDLRAEIDWAHDQITFPSVSGGWNADWGQVADGALVGAFVETCTYASKPLLGTVSEFAVDPDGESNGSYFWGSGSGSWNRLVTTHFDAESHGQLLLAFGAVAVGIGVGLVGPSLRSLRRAVRAGTTTPASPDDGRDSASTRDPAS